jgi:hypothetical protein
MHSTNLALVEHVDQRPVPTGLVPPVQLIHPIVDTHSVSTLKRDADYHFSFTASRDGRPAWYIVNGRGVPDDTLTAFARQLASSIGVEQPQRQLAPLLSYLSELARRGVLWYTKPFDLRAAWQEYLLQAAPYWKMAGGKITVFVVSTMRSRDLRALQFTLAHFYTFAIACQTYAYHHPFARKVHLIVIPLSWIRAFLYGGIA